MKSYLIHIECTLCGVLQDASKVHRLCPECGGVLYPRYDLKSAAKEFDRDVLNYRDPTMWRYFELLPIIDSKNIVTLGEGFTPIFEISKVAKELNCEKLFVKDESLNPTASFKARGLSAAISKASEFGISKVTIPSAGNAGGAMTAYASKAGMESYVFMPKDAPEANQKEVSISGAKLELIDGLISDAGKLSAQLAEELDLFDVSTLKEPYRVEGKKTMGYEIAEQFDWSLPDAIIYPTGGGTGIVGMWKAFDEMESMGWIDSKRPKMFSVQSDGCAPIVKAFEDGKNHADPWLNASTIAAGIRVPVAVADYLILEAVRESGGKALTVTDESMLTWMKTVASLEGMFFCPEGAATLSALKILFDDGSLLRSERILILNTGSGLKYLELVTLASNSKMSN
ncbi:MAG: threonine synthase [SAR202 cluster bacterium]|nr:threonine synthase [SAR202 cluster bacterium]